MMVSKGVLVNFDSGSYTATIQLNGSWQAHLEGITVARNIAAAAMVAGRQVAVVFFDEHNPREGVVVAVYT
jgi:hypothetical protein